MFSSSLPDAVNRVNHVTDTVDIVDQQISASEQKPATLMEGVVAAAPTKSTSEAVHLSLAVTTPIAALLGQPKVTTPHPFSFESLNSTVVDQSSGVFSACPSFASSSDVFPPIYRLKLARCRRHSWLKDEFVKSRITAWMQSVIQSQCEKASFSYWVSKADVTTEIKFLQTLTSKLRYPIGWTLTCTKKIPADPDVKTPSNRQQWDEIDWYLERRLVLKNYSNKEKQVRSELFSYKKFGGQFDPDAIDESTFYNLIVRAEMNPDDFIKGKYGYRDHIYVRGVFSTKSHARVQDHTAELLHLIRGTLNRQAAPYVVIVYRIPESISIQDVYQDFFKDPGIRSRMIPTILETKRNALYLCFSNDLRCRLDLHQMPLSAATEKVVSLVHECVSNFIDSCFIITGRGNHSSGRAVLFPAIRQLLLSEQLKPFVRHIHAPKHSGSLTVYLHSYPTVDINGTDETENVSRLLLAVIEEDAKSRPIGYHQIRVRPLSDCTVQHVHRIQSEVTKLAGKTSYSLFDDPSGSPVIRWGMMIADAK